MLWPSRTKLGQAKTWGNFKNMHEGYDSDSSKALGNNFAPLLLSEGVGGSERWGDPRLQLCSDALLRHFRLSLKMSIRLLSALRHALKT